MEPSVEPSLDELESELAALRRDIDAANVEDRDELRELESQLVSTISALKPAPKAPSPRAKVGDWVQLAGSETNPVKVVGISGPTENRSYTVSVNSVTKTVRDPDVVSIVAPPQPTNKPPSPRRNNKQKKVEQTDDLVDKNAANWKSFAQKRRRPQSAGGVSKAPTGTPGSRGRRAPALTNSRPQRHF